MITFILGLTKCLIILSFDQTSFRFERTYIVAYEGTKVAMFFQNLMYFVHVHVNVTVQVTISMVHYK